MAATSAGQQDQQQHKLNIAVAGATANFINPTMNGTVAMTRNQQQQQQQIQQQQQYQIQQQQHVFKQQQQQHGLNFQQLHMQQQPQQQFRQYHHQQQQQQPQQKYQSHPQQQQQQQQHMHRMQQQVKQQQQHLPAGLVNGNHVVHNNMLRNQQQQQQHTHTPHLFQQQQEQLHNHHHQQQQIHHHQHQQQQEQQQQQQNLKYPSTTTATTITPTTSNAIQNAPTNPTTSFTNAVNQPNNDVATSNVATSANMATPNANLAPGWRRLAANNEVVYISPTGAALRTPFQIKDYLLSPGTCKCGLPCPLRPEFFFDFNAQVPNMPLKMPTHENGCVPPANLTNATTDATATATSLTTATSTTTATTTATTSTTQRSSMLPATSVEAVEAAVDSMLSSSCLHQQRFMDSQQLHAHPMTAFDALMLSSNTDVKRRKLSNPNTASPGATPSSANNNSTNLLGSKTAATSNGEQQQQQQVQQQDQQEQQQQHHQQPQQQQQQLQSSQNNNNNMLPPTQQVVRQPQPQQLQHQQIPAQPNVIINVKMPQLTNVTGEKSRVPPLPQMQQQQQQQSHSNEMETELNAPNWQQQQRLPTSATRYGNSAKRSQSAPAKKQQTQPDFTNDPTGYLQQQTAWVHSSMMNIALGDETSDATKQEDIEKDTTEIFEQLKTQTTKLATKATPTVVEPTAKCQSNNNNNNNNNATEAKSLQYLKSEQKTLNNASNISQRDLPKQQQTNNQNLIKTRSEGSTAPQTQLTQRKNVRITSHQILVSASVNNQINGQKSAVSAQQQQQLQQKQPQFTVLTETSSDACNPPTALTPTVKTQQQNPQYRQQQKPMTNGKLLVPTAQESPVSSSTPYARSTPDTQRQTPDTNLKHPEQVGAISTSNESPRPCPPSPAESFDSTSSSRPPSAKTPAASPAPAAAMITQLPAQPTTQVRIIRQSVQHQHQQQQQPQRIMPATMANARTSSAATTTTTSIATFQQSKPTHQKLQANTVQKLAATTNNNNNNNNAISIGQLQLQSLVRANEAGNSQIIMTSTGQIIVMPSSNNKTQTAQQPQHATQQQQQVLITTNNGQPTATTSNVIIQQRPNTQVELLNGQQIATTTSGGSIILQNGQQQGSYIVSPSTAGTHSTAATHTQLQPTTVILNPGQNILTTNQGTKVLTTNAGNILHTAGGQQLITGNQLLATQNTSLGQQAVVLNQLPNGGYVIQQQQQQQQPQQTSQQFITQDGQVVSQIVQQQQTVGQPQRIIISTTSPDIKWRAKKRKSSTSSPSPMTTPTSGLSPQISPTIPNQTTTILQQQQTAAAVALAGQQQQQHQQQQTQVVQITPATTAGTTTHYPQQFQLSSGIQGIVVNKSQATAQPQQILLQNGQIIQPMNLISQPLIVPTGLVVSPEPTLLQIQNVLTAATPQGTTMMLRAQSPQNKQFISQTAAGQQFIVNSNGQLSPIGQIYSTPMGLMMPTAQQNSGTTAFVQQNTAMQVHQHQHQHQQHHQQQHHQHQQHTHQQAAQHVQQPTQHVAIQPSQLQAQQTQQRIVLESATSTTVLSSSSASSSPLTGQRSAAASPPDTTTHSPRSPERPPSHRSGGSDMVQCVSSSEPDGAVSPQSVDSRQSPSTTDCERGIVMSTAYQTTNIYKPSEAKIRRVQTPPQYAVVGGAMTSSNHNSAAATTTILATSPQQHQQQQQSTVIATSMPSTVVTSLHLQHQQQQHQHQQQQQIQQQHHNTHHLQHQDIAMKPDSHESPTTSPTTTTATPSPPPIGSPLQPISMSAITTATAQLKTPTKQTRTRIRPSKSSSSPSPRPTAGMMLSNNINVVDSLTLDGETTLLIESATPKPTPTPMPMRTFNVGELIWGPARGFPAWPGKIVKLSDATLQPTNNDEVWVQWFGVSGGRSTTELVAINMLKTLSEGLDAHHKAQKDTRKSRKLNSQLERAIQEAMTELDRISATSTTNANKQYQQQQQQQQQQPTSTSQGNSNSNNHNNNNHNNTASPSRSKRIVQRINHNTVSSQGGNTTMGNRVTIATSGNAGANTLTSHSTITTTTSASNNNNIVATQQRSKPIRIAPAPPAANSISTTKTTALSLSQGAAATNSNTK